MAILGLVYIVGMRFHATPACVCDARRMKSLTIRVYGSKENFGVPDNAAATVVAASSDTNARWIQVPCDDGSTQFLHATRHHLLLTAFAGRALTAERSTPSTVQNFRVQTRDKGVSLTTGHLAVQASSAGLGATLRLAAYDEHQALQIFDLRVVATLASSALKRRLPVTVTTFTEEETKSELSAESWLQLQETLTSERNMFREEARLTDGMSPNRDQRLSTRTVTSDVSPVEPKQPTYFLALARTFECIGDSGIAPMELPSLRALHAAANAKSHVPIPWRVADELQRRIRERQRQFEAELDQRREAAMHLLAEQRSPDPTKRLHDAQVSDRADALRDRTVLDRIERTIQSESDRRLRAESETRANLQEIRNRRALEAADRKAQREAKLKTLLELEEETIDNVTAVEKVRAKWDEERRGLEPSTA
jgi:hypothetical protein